MHFLIETNRLLLRDFNETDYDPYWKMTEHEQYQRFYREEDCSEEKAKELVSLFISQAAQNNRQAYQLAVILKKPGQFIGTCGLRMEPDRQASLGCGMSCDFHGEGFAEEAAQALIDFGFGQYNIHRIYSETLEENISAVRLCTRLGMRPEARFMENCFFKGKWWNSVVLAILKHEWNSQGNRCNTSPSVDPSCYV